jgi:outer membrane protein assembly factor BamB
MRMRTCRALLAAFAVSAAGCWVQPGGSAGRTHHAIWESTFTPDTVGDVVELWRSPVPATSRGTGPVLSPVASDGVVYAANQAAGLAAFDLATGTLVWGVEQYVWSSDPVFGDPLVTGEGFGLLAPISFSDDDPDSSYYSRSRGDHLAVYGAGGPLALTPDGWAMVFAPSLPGLQPTRAWLYYMDAFQHPSVALGPDGAVPAYALAGDVALWSEGDDAVAFSDCPVTGECAPRWRTPLGDLPVGPAVVGTDAVVYIDVGGTVHVLDLATGAVRYRAEVGSTLSVAPAVAGDTILVATDDRRLVALPAGGCGALTCGPLWVGSIGRAPATAPVAGTEVAYVARAGGGIAAFDLDGCTAHRCRPLTVVPTGATVTGGPILEPGRLIAGLADGDVVAFGLDGG